jgi:hypoxanthine phosphoribosyltransferase
MTMLFLPLGITQNYKSPDGAEFEAIGYRDYVNYYDSRKSDENLKNFRDLLLALKDDDKEAIEYFAELFCIIAEKVVGELDLIACVPGHEETEATRTDSMAMLARLCAEKLGLRDGSSVLRRVATVDSCHENRGMRKYAIQFNSIAAQKPAGFHSVKKILLMDDVYTSGTTMAACYSHLKKQFPRAKITGFAFGMTTSHPHEPWPQTPQFPRPEELANERTHLIADLQHEADEHSEFSRQNVFVMNRWNKKIHRLGCRHMPNTWDYVISFQQVLAEGGKPCRVCRPK